MIPALDGFMILDQFCWLRAPHVLSLSKQVCRREREMLRQPDGFLSMTDWADRNVCPTFTPTSSVARQAIMRWWS